MIIDDLVELVMERYEELREYANRCFVEAGEASER
jgi:hypothetical protein